MSAAVAVIGFSHTTWVPAARHSSASATCVCGGVSTWTTSGVASASIVVASV